MGYPELFINWLKSLYSLTEMCFLNGPYLTGSLKEIQSVRQGCPLSIHLFALYIEPLLVYLNKNLKGVTLLEHQVKARAFVDDIAIFTSCDNDILRVGNILDNFCAWTNARVNKKKTKALGLGAWRQRITWPIPWLESTPMLRLLGIEFSASANETADSVGGGLRQCKGNYKGKL